MPTVKYFFFRLDRERNPQGQYWRVLHALEGQRSYKDYMHTDEPVDTSYKVQAALAANHRLSLYRPGTIFGVRQEGLSLRDTRLRIYSRNRVEYYRIDAMVYPLRYPDGSDATVLASGDEVGPAPDDLKAAWRGYLARMEGGTAEAPVQQTAQPLQAAAAPASPRTVAPSLPEIQDEMHLIEMHLNDRVPNAGAMAFQISRLRDKMRVGIAKFTFDKQNGDRRIAYGTRNPAIMGSLDYQGRENPSQRTCGGAHFHYFDVEKADFRCFCVEDFVGGEPGVIDGCNAPALREAFISLGN